MVWSCRFFILLRLSVATCVLTSAVLWSLAGAVVIVEGVRSFSGMSLAGVLRGVHRELPRYVSRTVVVVDCLLGFFRRGLFNEVKELV